MGESGGLIKRRQELPRSVALATAAAYAGLFEEEDGSLPGAPAAAVAASVRGGTAAACLRGPLGGKVMMPGRRVWCR